MLVTYNIAFVTSKEHFIPAFRQSSLIMLAGCPVEASTLFHNQSLGSIFLRLETASDMGTWVKKIAPPPHDHFCSAGHPGMDSIVTQKQTKS